MFTRLNIFTRKDRNDVNRQRSTRRANRSSKKREDELKFQTPLPSSRMSGTKSPVNPSLGSSVKVRTLQLKEIPNPNDNPEDNP